MPTSRTRLGWGLLLCLLIPALASSKPKRHLLLISIDGLGADTFQQLRAGLPTLDRLAKKGAWGTSRTVFPSVTWPAHATLVTGRLPAGHGVVGNKFFDRAKKKLTKTWSLPAKGLVRAPTIWEIAKRAGLRTAAVLWPNVGRAPGIDWAVPEAYEVEEYERLVTPGLVDELEAAGIPARNLSAHSKVERWLIDTMAHAIATHLVRRYRPEVLAVHFVAPDTIAHHFGPASVERRWILELVDRYIGDLLASYEKAGLAKHTSVLVVSDHGFSPVRWRIDPDRLMHAAGLLENPEEPDRGSVRAIPNGYALFLYANGPNADLDAVERAFRKERVVEKSYSPADYAGLGLPSPQQNRMAPDRILVSPRECYFKKTTNKKVREDLGKKGMHGHHPDAIGNQPVFIASGRGVKRLEKALQLQNVDVLPTALRLLGLKARTPLDGKALTGLLVAP